MAVKKTTKKVSKKVTKKTKKNIEAGSPTPVVQITRNDVLTKLLRAYGRKSEEGGKEEFAAILRKYLKQESEPYACVSEYNILIMFDDTRIVDSDSDRIYEAINSFSDKSKPLLLVIYSRGGSPAPAYLIGKLCREFCNDKFIVTVPRRAKSAATLIACAADEIHMGSLSQLGPIDPQIDGMPALGLKNSIEHIAELTHKYKGADKMFARYMHHSIDPIQIGYYQRVAESAEQYAERLLSSHYDSLSSEPADIAHELVHGYKDHGFVIDKTEASEIFGSKTILSDTEIYNYGNRIYEILGDFEEIADLLKYNFYFIGSLEAEPVLSKKRN